MGILRNIFQLWKNGARIIIRYYVSQGGLGNLGQSSCLSNIFRLATEFNSIKHISGQPALDFINTVLAAATDLRFLGDNIQDQKIKWQLLGNLLPEYAGLVTALTNLDTDENPMNMEEVKVRILTEERMLIHRKVLPDHNAPPRIPQPPPPSQMPPPTSVYSAVEEKIQRCSACGVRNHQESECWHKHPDKAPSWKTSRSRPRLPRTPRDTNEGNERKKKDSDSSSENSEDYKRRKKHKRKHKEKRDSKKKKDKQKALTMLGTPTPATSTTPYIDHSCMMRLSKRYP